MNHELNSARLDALLQEESHIHNEISRIQEAQRKMVFSSLASSGGILPFITLATGVFKDDITKAVDIVVPLTMGLSFIFTMIFVVYIGLYFGILRLSQYALDVLYPHINAILDLQEQKVFQWEEHLRKTKRSKFLDLVTSGLYALAEAGSLFLLVVMYQVIWIYLLNYSGQPLSKYHYIFLGIVGFIICTIILLGARIVFLARINNTPNNSLHRTESPTGLRSDDCKR